VQPLPSVVIRPLRGGMVVKLLINNGNKVNGVLLSYRERVVIVVFYIHFDKVHTKQVNFEVVVYYF
jgi:hypothetical protein